MSRKRKSILDRQSQTHGNLIHLLCLELYAQALSSVHLKNKKLCFVFFFFFCFNYSFLRSSFQVSTSIGLSGPKNLILEHISSRKSSAFLHLGTTPKRNRLGREGGDPHHNGSTTGEQGGGSKLQQWVAGRVKKLWRRENDWGTAPEALWDWLRM